MLGSLFFLSSPAVTAADLRPICLLGWRWHNLRKTTQRTNMKSKSVGTMVDEDELTIAGIPSADIEVDRRQLRMGRRCFLMILLRDISILRSSIIAEVNARRILTRRTRFARIIQASVRQKTELWQDHDSALKRAIRPQIMTALTMRNRLISWLQIEMAACRANSKCLCRPSLVRQFVDAASRPDFLGRDQLGSRRELRNRDAQVALKLNALRHIVVFHIVGNEFHYIDRESILGQHIVLPEKVKQVSTGYGVANSLQCGSAFEVLSGSSQINLLIIVVQLLLHLLGCQVKDFAKIIQPPPVSHTQFGLNM